MDDGCKDGDKDDYDDDVPSPSRNAPPASRSLPAHEVKPNAEAAGAGIAYFPACVVVASASSLYPVAVKGVRRGYHQMKHMKCA